MYLSGHKKRILSVAEQAAGEWVKTPEGAEYAAAAQSLQSDGLVEIDAHNPPGISVRVIEKTNSA
jgi:hypothetical protein